MQVYENRLATVGGSTVSRALPQRSRRTIGAWCFLDHFGPSAPDASDGMAVGPHPHCGLSTVTWLIRGSGVHTDSLGSEQLIEPGQLNLMTAGHGISHAEQTPTERYGQLHGVQFWVAQPEATRHGPPAFEHHAELPSIGIGPFGATVLLGEFGGVRSPARTDTAIVGVEFTGSGSATVEIGLDPAFEHGVVVLEGSLRVDDTTGVTSGDPTLAESPLAESSVGESSVGEPGSMIYLDPGTPSLRVAGNEPTRWMLIGGEPFEAPVQMWWNFVGRTRDEMTEAVTQWNAGDDRFGTVTSGLDRIAAPPTP